VKKWIVTILVAVALLALALATHFWGARVIKFAVENDRTVDSVKKLLELLIAVGGLAVPAIKWLFGRTPQPQPRDEINHPKPALDEYVPKPRVLDAAIPSRVVKDRPAELLILVRLPNSPGLDGSLLADEDAEARPEDVRSKPFSLIFSVGPDGKPDPIRVVVRLSSPDFSPLQQAKTLFVPPDADSEVCHFLLTPTRTGQLRVLVELQWQDALHGSRSLRTECVAEAQNVLAKSGMNVAKVQMSASVAKRLGPMPDKRKLKLAGVRLDRARPPIRPAPATTQPSEDEFTSLFGTVYKNVPTQRDVTSEDEEHAHDRETPFPRAAAVDRAGESGKTEKKGKSTDFFTSHWEEPGAAGKPELPALPRAGTTSPPSATHVFERPAAGTNTNTANGPGEFTQAFSLSSVSAEGTDWQRAIEYHEQSVIAAREIGDRRGECVVLVNLGLAHRMLGDYRRAVEHCEKALEIAHEIGDREGEGFALFNMSLALDKLGDRNKAVALANAALKIYEQIEGPSATEVRRQLDLWRNG
jgi:hypothetical protein